MWDKADIFAGAATIKDYVADTADAFGIHEKIRFGRKVLSADWQSAESAWTVTATNEHSGETERYTCRLLLACTGYYDYAKGFTPNFPGVSDYDGKGTSSGKYYGNVDVHQWLTDASCRFIQYSSSEVVSTGSASADNSVSAAARRRRPR